MPATAFNADWTCRRPSGPFSAATGDSDRGTVVHLPHDALRDAVRAAGNPGAGAYYPRGAYTYTKRFAVPADWRGKVVHLEVEGAYRRAQVFCNDELAGNRADGYARFFADLTPYLRYGTENELRIEVRSGEDSRWYSGAGLHRPVTLHVEDAVGIVPDGVVVETLALEPDQAVVEVRTTVRNLEVATRTVRVRTEVDPAVRAETPITLAGGETATVRQRLYLPEPRPWSVDDPQLYRARVSVVGTGAAHVVGFGVRTISVDPRKGLRINGEPVLLRGACLHHDNGPLGAAAVGRAEERRVELLKAAGFNAIRAAHNPVSKAMLDACDRLGMLVVDEAFDMWTRFKSPYDYAAEFPQWWADDLAAMVAKDRNHPSVVMYSIGNEIVEVGTPHGGRWARRLAEHVRALDPTRPVTNGVNALLAVIDELPAITAELGGLNEVMAGGNYFAAVSASQAATTRTEESSSVLDVLGVNYGESRYAQDAVDFPDRVIVGSESFPSMIGRLWPLVVANPNVIGDFTWTGWDYLGEVGIGATAYASQPEAVANLEREFPYLTAWCGDLDITGFRRPVSYYREIVYGLRSEPFLAVRRAEHSGEEITMQSPWAWSDSISSWTWPGHEGRDLTVEVYADADTVRLSVDGREVGHGQVGTGKPFLAEIVTPYVPGTLEAVAFRDGVEVGRTTLSTAGAAGLTAHADRTVLRADDTDLSFLSVELRDSAGHLVTGDDREVSVTVTGAAVLAGMCSARPATTERFDQNTWRTFDGRALAVVRPTAPGAAQVRVSSPLLDDVVLDLLVEA
ncbi:glycoside hydrolase family 2 TIM barrel-domain containing protein [Kineococcus sp. SYSU DK003]|uniref:glycoside hydrolase family 2 TIM barrel-domain containing protein n=1 Tax=Kineococcus sp. SYSU DK003 TaxID=3383124 RepID=UPI003D7C6B8E